jgi:hypothetical protein
VVFICEVFGDDVETVADSAFVEVNESVDVELVDSVPPVSLVVVSTGCSVVDVLVTAAVPLLGSAFGATIQLSVSPVLLMLPLVLRMPRQIRCVLPNTR